MLLTGNKLTKWYGPRLLFQGITLGLAENERVGLIGANGSGKSTLLRIFAGVEKADEGELVQRKQLRVGYVPQENRFDAGQTVLEVVIDATDDHLDHHDREVRASILLSRAEFDDFSKDVGTLSGGWSKRLAIVREIAREPDLLLMDEPTNHLDVEGILWLEDLLDAGNFATLTVSHDRRFLEEAANRIIELGKQYAEGFLSHNGTYSEFVEKREEFLAAQQGRQKALASGVRREIEWLRRGAKARTTKAKGRIDRAGEMMSELADIKQRNTAAGAANIDFTASDRKTRKLIELKGVSKSLGNRELFKNVNAVLSPGSKLGLLGPNGSGKSTLIKLLSDQLKPDAGQVVRADQLKVVVFDQHREQLDQTQTLRRTLSPMGDSLIFQGSAMHVTAWAKQFLFRNDQLDLPVSELSGGEQARVLIARLMLQPADVLILDEPTNDLDIATLDVLETSLEQFSGALLLVTHDRYLLDRVSTEILALDGKGNAKLFATLAQWETAREEADRPVVEKKPAVSAAASAKPQAAQKKRLTWNEQRELEGMETAIHAAEARVEELQSQVSDPAVLSDHVKSREAFAQLAQAEHQVETLYARWQELEARK